MPEKYIKLQDALNLFAGNDIAGPKPSAIRTMLAGLPSVEVTATEEVDAALESLNFYRNQYYAEPVCTEQGETAQAINTVLPLLAELFKKGD